MAKRSENKMEKRSRYSIFIRKEVGFMFHQVPRHGRRIMLHNIGLGTSQSCTASPLICDWVSSGKDTGKKTNKNALRGKNQRNGQHLGIPGIRTTNRYFIIEWAMMCFGVVWSGERTDRLGQGRTAPHLKRWYISQHGVDLMGHKWDRSLRWPFLRIEKRL